MSGLIPNRFFQESGFRKFPPQFNLHLPLQTNLSPQVGSGGGMTVTRATEKHTQTTANAFSVDDANVLSLSTAFDGFAANGLCVEGGASTDCQDGDDLTGDGWTASNCAVSAKNVTDPAGAANEAQTLTPSANGGYVLQDTGAACTGVSFLGSCWIRRKAGAAGSHTGQIVLTDSEGATVSAKDITITAAWQLFTHYVEAMETGTGEQTAYLKIVPDKTAQSAVDVRMPFAGISGNCRYATPAISTTDADVVEYDCHSEVQRLNGTVYLEVFPLSDLGAVTPVFLTITPISGTANSRYVIGIEDGTNLVAYCRPVNINYATANFAVNSSNWATATWHKIAFTYGPTRLDLYLDGALVGSKTSGINLGVGALPATAKLILGSYNSSKFPNSIIKNVRYWPGPGTAAQCVRITR